MCLKKKEKDPKVDLMKQKLAMIEYEDDNPLKPKVHIAESVFEGLCASWKDALVLKLQLTLI